MSFASRQRPQNSTFWLGATMPNCSVQLASPYLDLSSVGAPLNRFMD